MSNFGYSPNMPHPTFSQYSDAPFPSYPATAGHQSPYQHPVYAQAQTEPYYARQHAAVTGAQQLHSITTTSKPNTGYYSPVPSPLDLHSSAHHLSASSESGASYRSTASSAVPSPYSQPQVASDNWVTPVSYPHDSYFPDMLTHETMTANLDQDKVYHMTMPLASPLSYGPYHSELGLIPSPNIIEHPGSPAGSIRSHANHLKGSRSPAQSPYLRAHQYHPYAMPAGRRGSTVSAQSQTSQSSPRSGSHEAEESREKGQCPFPDCRKIVKDLKAHIWTHQETRPEKCPIPTCEYHIKGFARKYDKNRHTLTHYKGTMVCGFCPAPGSAAEKSFNRADVFKRHLMTVHGVEQAPPNSRRKSPTAKKTVDAPQSESSGTCSTCHITFANAQDFYEHLDDCVLRVVQQVSPSEAVNEKHLMDVSQDANVKARLERHNLTDDAVYTAPSFDERDNDSDADGDDDDLTPNNTHHNRNSS